MDGRTEWTDGRTDAKTISIRLCRGIICFDMHASRGGGGGGGGSRPPLKNHKAISLFTCNTGQNQLKKHKATKPAFNVGPSSAPSVSLAGQ